MPNDSPKPVYTAIEIPCSVKPLSFDSSKCIGCNRCAAVCQVDIMIPSEVKGSHPIVLYPGECYYCGSCEMSCPTGAIHLKHPLMNRTKFIEAKPPEIGLQDENPKL